MAPDPHALKRAQAKEAIRIRTEFNHEVALARVDLALDVIGPAKERIEQKFAAGQLEETQPLELESS